MLATCCSLPSLPATASAAAAKAASAKAATATEATATAEATAATKEEWRKPIVVVTMAPFFRSRFSQAQLLKHIQHHEADRPAKAKEKHKHDQQDGTSVLVVDLVIVDLYPFEQTVASGASDADIIEKIDIGGISLIRAGAKNFNDVVIVPSKAEYKVLLDILNANGAETSLEERKMFAERAFGVSSHYDTAIHAWFAK